MLMMNVVIFVHVKLQKNALNLLYSMYHVCQNVKMEKNVNI